MRFTVWRALIVTLIASMVNAGEESMELRSKIRQSLEALQRAQVQGIENCENKCDKAFNRFAYEISTAGDEQTFEFLACVRGCNQCQRVLDGNITAGNCFTYCKNFDWKSLGVVKGVIEPDKACIGGCVINTW
jgi:hypothetical protein